ncbi:GNAT family N-acetyltransferase [Sphingobium cloacae]|nr:GNAT family N-acetyltransferase [Sphingobium cloacae]
MARSSSMAALAADPHIVATWIRGWTMARGTPPPIADHGGFRVDVGWPEQRVRYVFPGISSAMKDLAAKITEPWILVKACATPAAMRAALPARWSIQPPGFMMICRDVMTGTRAMPDGYMVNVTRPSPVAVVEILAPDGTLAAIGRVVQVDAFAIYDRIETHGAHRRRGLGRAVMKSLESIAWQNGAKQGLLVATAEGRKLYEALGWEVHALYTTAAIPPPT